MLIAFSGQSDNASVTIKLGKSTLKSISRSGGRGTGYLLNVELKGTFTETRTAEITEDGTSITFENIPEGSRIYAEASIYTNDNPDTILYSGKSETISIAKGDNTLALVMSKTVTLAAALEDGAVIVCTYHDSIWGDKTPTFKCNNGAYTRESGPSDATLTKEGGNLVLVFSAYQYIYTTTFKISEQKYTLTKTENMSYVGARAATNYSLQSITINGVDITSSLTQE